jgi:hypothetical protein
MLLESCREMVLKNISKPLDDKTLEIMQYVVLALLLTKEDLVIEKIPTILQEIDIYVDNKSIIEMAHEYLNNYQEDDTLSNSDACITRAISVDDNGTILGEQRTILISQEKNVNAFEIISKLIHEFIHLLRFGGIEQIGASFRIKDGIAVSFYNGETKKLHRKHVTLEEGIVQKYTNEAIHTLATYLRKEKINTDIVKAFQKEYRVSQFANYYFETTLIQTLCQNPEFNKLVEESFTDTTIPSPVIHYFNMTMNSGTAFMELESYLDKLVAPDSNDFVRIENFKKAKAIVSKFMKSKPFSR